MIMSQDIEISSQDRDYLRKFFNNQHDWLINHLTPTIDDIIEFITMLECFIKDENLSSNPLFQSFLNDLYNELSNNNPNNKKNIILSLEIKKKSLFYAKWYYR